MHKKKLLVLLAGSPATGKSFLMEKIRTRFNDLFSITPDESKIYFWEKYGFDNPEEKAYIEKEYAWPFYYQVLGLFMSAGKELIVSEYPFSDKQKKHLNNLAQENDYGILTIRLEAPFDILWERRNYRDHQNDRHLAFTATGYREGELVGERKFITKEEFLAIVTDRKYGEFTLGKTVAIDVSDFSKVDYSGVIESIENLLSS